MRSYMRRAGCWSRVELRDSSMASRWLTTGDEVMINSRLMCCGDDRLEVSEPGEWTGRRMRGKLPS
jgi:hypothetical protein